MSGHLHDDTSLYYITFFVERHISKTSSLLLTDSPCKQYNYSLSWYYTRRITTNIFNSRMRLVRQRLHGFINLRPPLIYAVINDEAVSTHLLPQNFLIVTTHMNTRAVTWQQIHNRLLANHNQSINWLIDISLYLVTINKPIVFKWVLNTNSLYHYSVIATLVLHSLQVMFTSYPLYS